MRKGDDVAIDTILRISRANGGAIHVGGDVDLGREPVTAKVAATWNDIVVPAAWVGQELHTHGELNLQGSAQAYTARGTLALGPQDRVADIALDVQGTPQRVELKQFDISQQAGRLAARGRIDLQPQLAWDVTAVAKDFDPGAFAAGVARPARLRSREPGPAAGGRSRSDAATDAAARRAARPAAVGERRPGAHAAARRERHARAQLRPERAALPRPQRRPARRDGLVERCVAQRLGAGLRRRAAGRRSSSAASGPSCRSTATRAVATCTPRTCAWNPSVRRPTSTTRATPKARFASISPS